MKRLLPVCIALALTGCAVYDVKPDETSLKSAMTRWAAQHGKTVQWDVDDISITNPGELAHALRFSYTLKEAVSLVIDAADRSQTYHARQAHGSMPRPLEACIFDNTVRVSYHNVLTLPCSD